MPISSLSNFTVPLGSTGQSASTQGLLMPKLKWRFRLTFLGFGITAPSTELTKQVIDWSRPELEFEPKVIDVYNSKVKYAGKPSWSDTTVNLRDDAQGNVARLVGEQIQKQFDFMEQASAASAIDYKFELDADVLDGGNGTSDPIVLETWQLLGCYVRSVNYGEVTYESSDPMTIQLSIAFDNAIQSPVGIGNPVPRTEGASVTG